MRRRDFLLLASAGATVWKPAVKRIRAPRIGFIEAGSRQESQKLLDAFRDSLAALGWIDGNNIAILDRWAEGQVEGLPGIVRGLIGSGVDVLVTVGTAATLAAKRATRTIPIVLVGVDDPAAVGVVDSRAPDDGNVTGLSLSSSELIEKRLRLLQELVRPHRLAVIIRDDPGIDHRLLVIRSHAERMGMELLALQADSGKALERSFERLRGERCEAVYVASGPLGPAKRARIIALAIESRVPAIYPLRIFAVDGGLMSFAAEYDDLFRRAAGFVDKIIGGADPGQLPIERPTKFDFVINVQTAQALDLTMPPGLLAAADELIE
jgi:putative ABC transport system substrate-binding protein